MDPNSWSVDEVVAQVATKNTNLHKVLSIKPILNLERLEEALRDNDIDGETLLSLEDVNIKEDLGIVSFGQRREVRKIIQYLQSQSVPQTSSESQKRRFEESDNDPSEKTPELKKQRRIQPQLVSAEPLTQPGDFDPDGLEGPWKEFLARHQEDSDDEILRPYGESDHEKELDSDDSLLNELDSESDVAEPHLSSEQVALIIDESIQEYKEEWIAQKRYRKHKTALRRWMSAARAGTRKPQQNALEQELEQYRKRLAKFRASITDASMEYGKVDELKRNCLNLQATVEDIMEREYYLATLSSNEPPPIPEQTLSNAKQETLAAGEEILESSESGEDASERSDAFKVMSVGSESGVSLQYDPLDDDWQPHIPPAGGTTSLPTTPQPSAFDMPLLEEQTALIQPKSSLELELNAHVSPIMQAMIPTIHDELPISRSRRLPAEEEPELVLNDSEDSDFDRPRLPQSRYRQHGDTLATAISLGSSPSASGSEQNMLTDHSIRTPPLNPTLVTPTKIKFEQRPPLQPQWPSIQETRNMKWADVGKNAMLALCKIVYRHTRTNAADVLEHASQFTIAEIPEALRAGIAEIQDTQEDKLDEVEDQGAIIWTFFFIVFANSKGFRNVWEVPEDTLDDAYDATDAKGAQFDRTLKPLLRFYIDTATKPSSKQVSKQKQTMGQPQLKQSQLLPVPHSTTSGIVGARSNFQTPPQLHLTDTDTEDPEEPSSVRKRKRHVQQSQEALALQKDDRDRVEAQEERRQMLMMRFQAQEASGEARYVPVNTEDPTIYLDQHIARRIKEHQITGIQFIWRELVEDQKHQGCLLAHTMGLGKTMQVISFLVTLAQANESSNPKVRNLVPETLRSKKVLVMCPASLVDNWFDEILMWTPPENAKLLGEIYKIFGSRTTKIGIVKEWSANPGVLLVSYESLRSLVNTTKNVPSEELANLKKWLLEEPCIVIGDEAHKMKNAKSSLNQMAKRFVTMSRIALTGSPLNNHLEEYHTMIDWIAPGYLGNLVQFKVKYSEPIARGLYEDSTRYEKRKSLEKLYVLKRDLAPKIDRKDISAIAADMPNKTEFFISVSLTGLQKEIYTVMVQHILAGLGSADGVAPKSSNAMLWSWLSILSWLCNHPSCLIHKLEEKDADGFQTAMDKVDTDEESVMPADIDLRGSPITKLLPRFLEAFKAIGKLYALHDPSLSTRAMITRDLISESIALGEKILLFSHSIPTLNFLQTMLEGMGCKYLRIDGSTRTDQRQIATKYFNEAGTDYMIFLISTRAGGLGLNLQGANRVIIYDFGFNPSWEEQAIGRAYRLGQKKSVTVYRFKSSGTFEEAIYNKSIFKTQLFSRVVDQKNVIRQASRKIEDYLFTPIEVERNEGSINECLGKDALLDKVVRESPYSIKNLVLTETFQREDEEDELTAEERKQADEEVELERLARINPEEYARRDKERKIRQAIQRASIPNPHFNGQHHVGNTIAFGQIWQPASLVPPSEAPVRSGLSSTEDAESPIGSTPRSGDDSKPPGCQQQ